MNEKLSLPAATAIEQLQQQQAHQPQQQQHHQKSTACPTIDHADYHYELMLPASASAAATATTYNHESNSNNAKACGIDVGNFVERIEAVAGGGGGGGTGSDLYRYASVASLGGGGGGVGGSAMLGMDAFMTSAVTAAPVAAATTPAPPTTILKMSNNGSRGSNLNSPHKQQLGAPTERVKFCGCFGGSSDSTAVGVGAGERAGGGDKQQLPTLTFWPALFANLGICTLLLGYLFIGSFLFLTIETSGDGGSAAGVVSDPNAWSHAQNAYISTKQEQQQHQQHQHKHTPQTGFAGAQSKLYQTSEPLLDVVTAGGVRLQGTATATADGSKPHVVGSSSSSGMSSNFHMNTAHEARRQANSTTAAVAHFDVIAKPETETYIDNRHANKLRPSSSMTAQQPNDVATAAAGMATYATLRRQATAVEAQAYRAATNAIGSDINGDGIDAEVGVGIDDVEDIGDGVSGVVGGSWGGENVQLQRTVENIWDITVSLNILYKENWTKLAALEINKFQDQLVKRLVMDLSLSTALGVAGVAAPATTVNEAHSRQQQTQSAQEDNIGQQQPSQPYDYHSMESATSKHYGNDAAQQRQQQLQQQQLDRYWQLQAARQRQWQLQQQQQQFEWNFATSFLYSLTVVTTVGYGTITPRTTLGRMVTIVYATLGIPLTLVYLSSIGSILAKLAAGFCERLLCCCFCRASANKRHTVCGFSRQQVSDKKCNLKLQQLQKHHQQQQQHAAHSAQPTAQQQQQQQTVQATQSAHLPYCYVRPPADDALSYAEHSPLSAHSGTRSSKAPTLRWSLALPLGFCVLLLLAYVAFGSLAIALLEQWSLFDGIYFCFMSLTTIGFCDLLPGAHVRPATTASTLVVWFCAAYILSGLTLTSMCVNLLHDEFLQRMRLVVQFKKIATGKSAKKERSFYGAPP